MTTLDQIAGQIIKEQELIIGPLAWDEANLVKGLSVLNKETGQVSISEGVDKKLVINQLVKEYEVLFGRAAREVCREAARGLVSTLSQDEVPSSLR